MSKTKSIKHNALLNGIRTVLNLLFPLITFPYVSRVLEVDEIGKYNFSSSIVSYFLMIAALGFDKFAIREGAQYRDNRKQISEFASKVFSLNMLATVVSYILLFILLAVSQKLHSYAACIMIFAVQIFFSTLGTEWLYSIYEEYTYITIRSIVFKVISIGLLFVFVRNSGDYIYYAAITVFASVGSNILNFINARKYCDIRFTFDFDWKKLIKPVLIIFASNVAIQIYVNSDITMLGFFQNDSVVGIYSVSTKIYTIARSFLSAVLVVSIPRLAMYAGKKMQDEYNVLFQKINNSLLVLVVPAVAGLIMLKVNVIRIIAGDNYLGAAPSLCILSLAIIFAIYSTLFNQCTLLPFKREKYSLISSIMSAGLNVLLNLILIPYMAEVGAAITTLTSEFTMAVMNYLACKDIIKALIIDKKNVRNIISVLIGTGAVVFVCIALMGCIENIWIETIACVVASVLVYGIILIIFKNPVLYSVLKEDDRL